MGRYTGPKHKQARREGVNLTGTRSRSLGRRLDVPPGSSGGPRRGVRRGGPRGGRQSEYAQRLRTKQRFKREYGMSERQFRRFFAEALRMPGSTADNLVQLCERRLDNVVVRLGFSRTHPMARQLVVHRHVEVDGRTVDIPSYLVRPGQTVAIDEIAQKMPDVQSAGESTRPQEWLERQGPVGRIVGLPSRADADPGVELDRIVEFHAR